MLTLMPVLEEDSGKALYQQLFTYIRDSIVRGDISPGKKLPSLRRMAQDLNISTTTVRLAYDQLLVEGYIESKAKSGYYAGKIALSSGHLLDEPINDLPEKEFDKDFFYSAPKEKTIVDDGAFDFNKWKTCANKVFNDYSNLLLTEGEIQGEIPLRDEIAGYIYQARGVKSSYEQIVIGAGTQQLINLLCILLKQIGIDHASFENPGYIPVRSIFADRSFKLSYAPLDKEGILVNKLPANIPSVVYVSPSNQFPTGSVMSVARRYELLEWADRNKSLIIEDDYNSELRYDSRPVPSLQGLDNKGHVVYLGSFSSTLFPSIKISYMVLPENLHKLFTRSLGGYVQTCSKAEQLTLAIYMHSGYYQTHLRRQRNLNGKKIQAATELIKARLGSEIEILNNSSGLHMLLQLKDKNKSAASLAGEAAEEGLTLTPLSGVSGLSDFEQEKDDDKFLFYYTRIPMKDIEAAIDLLLNLLIQM